MSSSFPEVEGVLTEIFRRLPLKSVGRCRCVQKSWYYFTKNPSFNVLHLNHQKQFKENKFLLLSIESQSLFTLRSGDNYTTLQKTYKKPPFSNKYRTPYGISNGVLCLSSPRSELSPFTPICLWNPAINKFKTLPSIQLYRAKHIKVLKITGSLSFGYLPKINDFKVIKVMNFYLNTEKWCRMAHVYSLSTDSWKRLSPNNIGEFTWCDLSEPTYVNGSSYWIAEKENGEKVIAFFDMEKEKFGEIELPEHGVNKYKFYLLYNFDELLHLIIFDRKFYSNVTRVREGAFWMKKRFGKSEEEDGFPLFLLNNGRLITLTDHNDFLDFLKIVEGDDLLDGFFNTIHDQMFSANSFVESLVLLDNVDN